MVKKGIDDLLFPAHKFLAFLESVRLALDVNDGAVVQDTVENGGGDCNVGENDMKLSISVDRLTSRIQGVSRQQAKSHKSAAA